MRITGIACAAAAALFLLGGCGFTDVGGDSEGLSASKAAWAFQGCTLTPGYWKTHSKYGPAKYDDAWAVFEGGPLTDPEDPIYDRTAPCYDVMGLTFYEQFWQQPEGNAWLILFHQYTAAWLNYYNGANPDEIIDQLDVEARDLLYNHCPGSEGFDDLRADFIELATLLDDYNNGLVGPPHCD